MSHSPFPPPTAAPTPRPPAIPRLAVLDTVARGGQGTVYVAHQIDHDRVVALKVLDARLLDDATCRRFDRERIALGRISDHPCIVSLLDSGYAETGEPYLLLEYAPGGTLAERLEAGTLGLDEATRLAVCLAGAVEAAHHAGIIHRDIKPANVMRSAYGEWMLTDFGIASLVDAEATSTLQASYAHAAPETFEGAEITPLADVYSLASVLATGLTGEEPFAMADHETAASAVRRIGDHPYPDLRRAGVPNDIAAFLEQALSKDPDHRPVSAYSFGVAINELRGAHGLMPIPMRTGRARSKDSTVIVDGGDPERSESERADRSPTRRPGVTRRLMIRAAAMAMVASLAGGAWFASRTDAAMESTAAAADAAAQFSTLFGAIDDLAADDATPDDLAADDATPDDLDGDDATPDDLDDGNDGDRADEGDGDAADDGLAIDGNGTGPGNGGNGDGNGNGNGGRGNGNGGNGPGNRGAGNGGGNGPGGNN